MMRAAAVRSKRLIVARWIDPDQRLAAATLRTVAGSARLSDEGTYFSRGTILG